MGPGAHQTRKKIHDRAKKNKTIFADYEEELKPDDTFNTLYYREWFIKPGSYLKMDIDEAEREIKTRFDDFKKGDMKKIIKALKQV